VCCCALQCLLQSLLQGAALRVERRGESLRAGQIAVLFLSLSLSLSLAPYPILLSFPPICVCV